MGTIKDVYEVLKDLMQVAKEFKNQEMISLAMDLQSMFFEFKEEIENIKDENKTLKEEIEFLKLPIINKDDIVYTQNGFFTLKSEKNKIPYCSACWKLNKKIVPLAKGTKAWYHYSCPCCKVDVSIMDACGNDILTRK